MFENHSGLSTQRHMRATTPENNNVYTFNIIYYFSNLNNLKNRLGPVAPILKCYRLHFLQFILIRAELTSSFNIMGPLMFLCTKIKRVRTFK